MLYNVEESSILWCPTSIDNIVNGATTISKKSTPRHPNNISRKEDALSRPYLKRDIKEEIKLVVPQIIKKTITDSKR